MFVQIPTLEAVSVVMIVTTIRTILEASPTILGGVVVAAWLRTLATPERVQSIFCGDGLQGSVRTLLVAVTLPVCSIGVLPVLRELRRLGLPNGKLITLALVAPLLNPVSLLYGLTVLSATQLFMVVVGSGMLGFIILDVGSRFAVTSEVTAEPRPAGLAGGTRVRNHLIACGIIMTGWLLVDLLVVILVSGITISLIPFGTFVTLCETTNRSGPVTASLLAIPQYIGPARGILQFAAIDRVSLSVPTGLAIYYLGVGLGASNVFQLVRWFGPRRIAALAVGILLFVWLAAYAYQMTIPTPARTVGETIGLDGLAVPAVSTIDHLGETVGGSLWFMDPFMYVATIGLGILIPAGLVIRATKIGYHDDDPNALSDADSGRLSKAVPASQLGAIAIGGIAILCFLSTYIFFPAPRECLEDMQGIQIDANLAIRRGDVGEALDRIAAWDSILAKLPICAAVHWSFPSPPQRQATRDLRAELYSIRVFLQDGDVVSARKRVGDLMRLLSKIKETYAGGSS